MALVTVVGTGFTGATQCFFGSTAVGISLNADGTSFTCTPPAGEGTVSIGITSAYGVADISLMPKCYIFHSRDSIRSNHSS